MTIERLDYENSITERSDLPTALKIDGLENFDVANHNFIPRINENGLLETETDDYLVKDFLDFINTIIPNNWSELIEQRINLIHPMHGGKVITIRDYTLTRGIPVNDLIDTFTKFPNVGLHVNFALSLLDFMRTSDDSKSARFVAFYALNVAVPILKAYKLATITGIVEDTAFQIVDPKGYEFAKNLWMQNFGKRLSVFEVEELGNNMRGILYSAKKVICRQKSLLSFASRWASGRSIYHDRLAFTAIYKNQSPGNVTESNYNPLLNFFVNGVIRRNLMLDGGFALDYYEDMITNPRSGNFRGLMLSVKAVSDYWGFQGDFFREPFEVRLQTEEHYEDSVFTHLFYKATVTHVGAKSKRQIGSDPSDLKKVGDIAMNLLADEKPFLDDLVHNIKIRTANGNHVVLVPTDLSLKEQTLHLLYTINRNWGAIVGSCLVYQDNRTYRLNLATNQVVELVGEEQITVADLKFTNNVRIVGEECIDSKFFPFFTLDNLLESLQKGEADIDYIKARYPLINRADLDIWTAQLADINMDLCSADQELILAANQKYEKLRANIEELAIRVEYLNPERLGNRDVPNYMRKLIKTNNDRVMNYLATIPNYFIKIMDPALFNTKNGYYEWIAIYSNPSIPIELYNEMRVRLSQTEGDPNFGFWHRIPEYKIRIENLKKPLTPIDF